MAALVLLVVVIGGVLLIAGGGDDDETTSQSDTEETSDEDAGSDDPSAAPASGGAESPEAAVDAFFDAIESGDCEGIVGSLAPEAFGAGVSPDDAVAECEADSEGLGELAGLEVIDTTLVSETGDDAVVSITATFEGETETRELPLVRVDGDWFVASLD